MLIFRGKALVVNKVDSRNKRGKATRTLPLLDINKNPPLEYEEYLKLNIVDVEVGRACPFNCYYCSLRNLLGNNVRYCFFAIII